MEERPSLEDRQAFVIWFYQKYGIILGQREAEVLMNGQSFKRVNKFAWKETIGKKEE